MKPASWPVLVACLLVGHGVTLAQSSPGANKRSGPSTEARLMEAYKREFAFLEAEKRQLEARLAEEKRQTQARLDKARADNSRLQGRVVAAASEAEGAEEQLLMAERELASLDQSENVVGDILLRADSALSRVGIELPEADAEDRAALLAQLRFVFERAPEALAEQAAVRTEPGAYFDAAGEKVEGPVLRIGSVASYGLADGAMGPLAPAGQDRLKVWPSEDGAAVARRLAQGQSPDVLPMFLYESLETGIEKKQDKTALQVIRAGGTIAWVIVALGLVALLMIIARALLLLRASAGNRKLIAPVLERVEGGDVEGARALAARRNNSGGRVLTATLAHLDKSRGRLEDIVAEAILHEQPHLSRFGAAIMVVAAVAPLMGLLGTVTGMISTFEIITEFGTGNPKLLSGGISEALITTELGLIVAIPALLVGQLLTGWSERIRDNLDASALATINRAHGIVPPAEDELDAPTTAGELSGARVPS